MMGRNLGVTDIKDSIDELRPYVAFSGNGYRKKIYEYLVPSASKSGGAG